MSITENIGHLKKSLPVDVTLIAVSKTKPVEAVQEAYEAGQRDFGENYVQELTDKQKLLPADIRWHFIGHLQSNKVKYIAPFVYMIHGVDSLKLLEEINKQAVKNKRVINCLLQLHIAREETKFGLSFDECRELLRSDKFGQLNNVNVVGLMSMASNTDNEEQVLIEFKSVREFRDSLPDDLKSKLQILSIGMSGDYELAIKAGGNMVRIGSLIFGDRVYK